MAKACPRKGEPGGLGLQTMRHRAQRLGGQLTVENPPDGGTRVRCVAPYYRGKPAVSATSTKPSA